MPDRQLRIAIWSAVSSLPQARDDKTSLHDQERMGRDFAAAVNGIVTHTFIVPGHSRDYVLWSEAEADMPAYRQLRQAVDAREFDVLYSIDADRLGRDPALIEQVISLVDRSGAEVYLASSPHPLGQKTAGHRYLSAIQAVRAGEDQAIRVQRQNRGMRGRIARGLAAHHWPYGYRPIRNEQGHTVGAEFDDRIGAMRLATAAFVRGDSYLRIAEQLTAAGYQPVRARAWHHRTIHRMLHNDCYAGRTHWGGYTADAPSVRFPALWDAVTYQQVQTERHNRAGQWRRRHTNGPYVQVAFCARCGRGLTRARNQAGVMFLCCPTHHCRSVTGRACHPNYIKEARVTDTLQRYIRQLETPEVMEAALAQLAPDAGLQEQLEEAQHRIAAIDERRQRLALALAGGFMDGQAYRKADDVLVAELEGAEGVRADIVHTLALVPDREQRQITLEALRDHLDAMFQLPALQLNTELRNAGLKVLVEEGRIIRIEIT